MARQNFNELLAFVTVAREGSFTRAAASMSVSQSALSHTIRALEKRLDMPLLTRTTRSVSPTEAGDRLLATLAPSFEEIEAELIAITQLREKPAGAVRMIASEYASETILLPVLGSLLPIHPELRVEIDTGELPADFVAQGFDASVRLGEHLAKGMSAQRIGADLRMALAASPAYFARHARPDMPQQLIGHDCIQMRQVGPDRLPAWEFNKDGYLINVHVEGQTVVTGQRQARQAALAGLGLACTLADVVREDIDAGRLVQVLADWCPPFSGYHLHFPSERRHAPALSALLAALLPGPNR